MPFDQRYWKNPEDGDLVYGVNSDWGRKYYLKYHPQFKSKKVLTVDSMQVMVNETGKTRNQEFLDAIANHNKYKTALNDPDTKNQAVRRKCKAGLDWAVVAGKQIHFILDGLNLDEVIKKNHVGKNSDRGKKVRTIKIAQLPGLNCVGYTAIDFVGKSKNTCNFGATINPARRLGKWMFKALMD